MVAVLQDLNDPEKLGSHDMPDNAPEVIYQEPNTGQPLHRPFVRPGVDPKKRLARVLLEGKAQVI